jgi:hypothetical protein
MSLTFPFIFCVDNKVQLRLLIELFEKITIGTHEVSHDQQSGDMKQRQK